MSVTLHYFVFLKSKLLQALRLPHLTKNFLSLVHHMHSGVGVFHLNGFVP